MADYYDLTYAALCEPEVLINAHSEELVNGTVEQFEETTSNSASTIDVGDGNTISVEPQSYAVVQSNKISVAPGENGTVVKERKPNFNFDRAREKADRASRAISDHIAVSMEDIVDRAHIELEHCYTAYNEPELFTIVKSDQMPVLPRTRGKDVKKQQLDLEFYQTHTSSRRPKRKARQRKLGTKRCAKAVKKLRSHAKKPSNAKQTPTIREEEGRIGLRRSSMNHGKKRDQFKMSAENHEMEMNKSVPVTDFLAIELNKPAKRANTESKTFVLTALTGEALLNSEDGSLTSYDILEYISRTHPQYKHIGKNKRLKSCFHDVLSRKPHFSSTPRREGEKSKRWRINSDYIAVIKEMITQRETLYGENASDSEPFQYFVDATLVKDDVSISGYLPSAVNGKETTRSTNPIEPDDTLAPTGENVGLMPEVISYCSSASSSFPIERAIESISQQECRESPATDMSCEQLSLCSEDDEVVIEEKVTTFAESTVLEVECPICDQMFSSNESLGAHMSVHRKRQRLSGPPALPATNSLVVSPATNSLVVSSSNDSNNLCVANGATASPCNDQSDENMRRALNSLPSSLFSGQRPIIFMGNVYFNNS